MSENNMLNSRKKRALKPFLIALVVTIVLSFLNWGVITSWGDVRITRLTLVGNDGLRYSALMYVPKEARVS